MDNLERTRLLSEMGCMLDLNMGIWTGHLMVSLEDLGCPSSDSDTATMGTPAIRVMPKDWVKSVKLLKGSIKKRKVFTHTPILRYSGGRYRYILKEFIPQFIIETDKAAGQLVKYYQEIYEDEKTYRRLAKTIIRKNAQRFWTLVRHKLPKYKGVTEAPPEWVNKIIETIMDKHFPPKEQLMKMGFSYSIYNLVEYGAGQYQRPKPGVVEDMFYLTRLIYQATDVYLERLKSKINIFQTHYKHAGVYVATFGRLKTDISRFRIFSPLDEDMVEYQELELDLSDYLETLDRGTFWKSNATRAVLNKKMQKIVDYLEGSYYEERKIRYRDLFDPRGIYK